MFLMFPLECAVYRGADRESQARSPCLPLCARQAALCCRANPAQPARGRGWGYCELRVHKLAGILPCSAGPRPLVV